MDKTDCLTPLRMCVRGKNTPEGLCQKAYWVGMLSDSLPELCQVATSKTPRKASMCGAYPSGKPWKMKAVNANLIQQEPVLGGARK